MDFITSTLGDIVKNWFLMYMQYLVWVANLVLTPINSILTEFFPNLNDIVTMFESFITTYITPFINYFFHLLPPNAMNLCLIYISCLVAFYTITLAIHVLIKAFEIIKSIKIW